MKKIRSFFAIILTFVMAVTLTPVQTDAAQKVELNKSKVTLYIGNSVTLKLKNTKKKVTWKSTNKSVATVSQKGVVKAKKQGSCKVTAKTASHKYVCKVIVKKKGTKSKKSGTNVYITNTGKKYHRSGCRYLWNSKIKIKLSDAKSRGYTACSVCW
ncbi:MAG: Ig-like domain-containing protein [Lachnospiraceae bacterium]|nr:Ig-like domain-containing protein [Lachnospiraceae bacterium]